MDSAEQKDAYQRTGTTCIETSSENFFQSRANKAIWYSDGQCSSPDLLSENRGQKKFTNGLSFQTYFGATMKKKVIVTAEYLPSALNKHSCIEFCRKVDSSKWKLMTSTFHRNWVKMGNPLIDINK